MPVPSLVNTPPVFAIFASNHVLKGLQRCFGDHGTLELVQQRAKRRAREVYKVIDESRGFYVNQVGQFRGA